MSEPNLGKIYLFCHALSFTNIKGETDVQGFAMAEDGTLVSGHISSNERWAKHDLHRPHHYEKYAAHYPDGYQLEFVPMDSFDNHAGLQAAIALNKAAGEAAKKEANNGLLGDG